MEDRSQVRVVYIVDNDRSVRTGLSRLIRANGLEARSFASSESFLEKVTAEPCSCVLLDITLPDLSGPQVRARLLAKNIDMPVIAISASDRAAARGCAHQFGAKFFLSKPIDDHALLDTIAWVTGMMDRQTSTNGDAAD